MSENARSRRLTSNQILWVAAAVVAIILLFLIIGAIWGDGGVDLLRAFFKLLVLFK